MTGSSPLGKIIPDLISSLGDWVGEHQMALMGIATLLSTLLFILNTVFNVRLNILGDVFLGVMQSNYFITLLVFTMIASQVLIFKRIEWLVRQFEPEEDEDGSEQEAESEEIMTDGSGLQPRDSKGRFKSSSSGGANLILLLLGAMGGYMVGAESTAIEPVTGVLIGIAAVLFVQTISE